MEQKKSLSPIIETKKVFRIINKRLEIGTSTTNKSGKKYTNELDEQATRQSFKKILDSIPAREGHLVLFGVNKFNESIFLGYVHCTENLRYKFSKTTAGSRLDDLIIKIFSQGLDHIQIMLCKVTNK